jgi:Soluble P-type ATPase
MRSYEIPDFGNLHLDQLVLDFNGTLATDGVLLPGVAERLALLAADMTLHVVTGDTNGTAAAQLQGLGCRLHVLPPSDQGRIKRDYVLALGAAGVVAIGNGRNDARMLQMAALGMAVLGEEGCAASTLAAADVLTRSITDALDLLLFPQRLVASLRA